MSRLDLVGNIKLSSPAIPTLVSVCPAMELAAVGTQDNHIQILRVNGQRIYNGSHRAGNAPLVPQKVSWKRNGRLLAIAWSDGIVRIVDPESSKVAHQIKVVDGDGDGGANEITCIAWATNWSGTKGLSDGMQKAESAWKQILGQEAGVDPLKEQKPLDLPRDLALLDIEPALPKLSTLSGGADDVFSSRASLDTLFRPFDRAADEEIDVLLVGCSDGSLHLTIYDSFTIGSFPSPIRNSPTSRQILVGHAFCPDSSMHGLLLKPTSSLVRGFSFVPMDLRFLVSSKDYLSVVSSRSTALQNLLRYISQTQSLMVTEYKASRQLPSRFLENVQDEFDKTASGWSIVPALYHLVLTGHLLPEVKEWMIDTGDRGYKRWDKAVSTSLNSLRSLVHKKLMPALTRIALICSRLHGLALYHSSTSQTPSVLGFSAAQIALLLDNTAALTLVAEHMLTAIVEEIDLFSVFSEWLRAEIGHAITNGEATEEQLEKESAINHAKVLSYIQNSLLASKLEAYYKSIFKDEAEQQWQQIGSTTPIFEDVTTALRHHEEGSPSLAVLLNTQTLIQRLSSQASTVFSSIALAEKRNVLFGSPLSISEGQKDGPVRISMLPSLSLSPSPAHLGSTPTTYIAQIGATGPVVSIHRLIYQTVKGVSGHVSTTHGTFQFPAEATVLDIDFLDSDFMLVLYSLPSDSSADDTPVFKLSRFPYHEGLLVGGYHELRSKAGEGTGKEEEYKKVLQRWGTLELDTEDGAWVPESVSVGTMARVVVVGKGGVRYKAYWWRDKEVVEEVAETVEEIVGGKSEVTMSP